MILYSLFRLLYSGERFSDVKQFASIEVKESHNRAYEAALYTAPLDDYETQQPTAVTLFEDKNTNHVKNLVAIKQPMKGVNNFTVCIKALHGPFCNYHGIVDFIESNRLFGADKFVFYDLNITGKFRNFCSQNH